MLQCGTTRNWNHLSFGDCLIIAETKPKPFVVLCTLYLSLTLSFMMCSHDNITINRRGCGSEQESKYHAHFCSNSLAVTKAETIPVTMYFVPRLWYTVTRSTAFSKFFQLPVSSCNSVNRCEPIREQNSNHSATRLDGTVLSFATRRFENLDTNRGSYVFTFPLHAVYSWLLSIHSPVGCEPPSTA